ncbi:uncharacterized protein AMSG_09805 [Thecamonas trahens ATCC 50062]|uniref:Uncharacterized protein n=1 Tax=Thecamonas trahens ATCC 50062 TaxID=461836 RepID=A0A0L0DNG9_THETB|nr:hypothetical protein AMSG_09805 [Thecamonas trahens ATCC 50062]KNC53854.1 hypothetical protein AMSG_09805 [Thecamonas trahens ATCC 50062]|eukprot:XP_013754234.1 hypothetical protein AMSG_09805 [Thecamonas trahens ATCC 50062]
MGGIPSRRSRTPLHEACARGDVRRVARMLEGDREFVAMDVNERAPPDGASPLHVAAAGDHGEVITYLLEKTSANPYQVRNDNASPLRVAVMGGRCAAAQALLAGMGHANLAANLRSVGEKVGELFSLAAASGNVGMLAILGKHLEFDIDARVHDCGGRVLHAAVWCGHVSATEHLLNKLAASPKVVNDREWTPLHVTALRSHAKVAKVIVGHSAADINAQSKSGRTPLHLAARTGALAVAEVLIASGAALDARSHDGFTPLHHAVKENNLDVASALLAAGARVDTRAVAGTSPLHTAALLGNLDAVRALLAAGAPVDALTTATDSTPLSLAAARGRTRVVSALVAAGADVNAPPQSPPLTGAAKAGHLGIVRELLKAGARQCDGTFDRLSGDAPSAVEAAARSGHTEVVALLVKSGADPERIAAALHLAAEGGHLETVRVLVELSPAAVAATDDAGHTAFELAARRGRVDVARFLARVGNIGPDVLASALHLAATGEHVPVMRVLVDDLCAPLDATHGSYASPVLVTAAQWASTAAPVAVLIDAGAPINAATTAGYTALHTAIVRGKADIVAVLLAAGAAAHTLSPAAVSPLAVAAAHAPTEVMAVLEPALQSLGTAAATDLLHRAAAADNVAALSFMLRGLGWPLTGRDASGRTLLHAARSSPGAVAELLSTEAAACCDLVAAPDTRGDTPLHAAVASRNASVVELLLTAACPAAVDYANASSETPLMLAASRTWFDGVVALLAAQATVSLVDSRGQNAAHRACAPPAAAAPGDAARVLECILAASPPSLVVAADERGAHPLHLAASHVRDVMATTLVAVLIDAGADVDAINNDSASPLSLAVKAGNTAAACALIAAGAEVNVTIAGDQTPIIMCGRSEVAYAAAQRPTLDVSRGVGGCTLLHTDLESMPELLDALLLHTPDLWLGDVAHESGMTPLMAAAARACPSSDLTYLRWLVLAVPSLSPAELRASLGVGPHHVDVLLTAALRGDVVGGLSRGLALPSRPLAFARIAPNALQLYPCNQAGDGSQATASAPIEDDSPNWELPLDRIVRAEASGTSLHILATAPENPARVDLIELEAQTPISAALWAGRVVGCARAARPRA